MESISINNSPSSNSSKAISSYSIKKNNFLGSTSAADVEPQ
jgi:hypothetical protein